MQELWLQDELKKLALRVALLTAQVEEMIRPVPSASEESTEEVQMVRGLS